MEAKFSQRVKEVIQYSREEAIRLGHDYIGCEHLLLGIIREGEGKAIQTIKMLDIDALRIVASGVNKLKSKDNAVVIITHYQRLLDHIVPDFVHVLFDGKIVKSGDKTLAHKLEEKGYDWIKNELAEAK